MATEDEVRQASDRFYAALDSMLDGNAAPMADVWSHDSTVSTMHPLGGREVASRRSGICRGYDRKSSNSGVWGSTSRTLA